jgi:hypothetical protein
MTGPLNCRASIDDIECPVAVYPIYGSGEENVMMNREVYGVAVGGGIVK